VYEAAKKKGYLQVTPAQMLHCSFSQCIKQGWVTLLPLSNLRCSSVPASSCAGTHNAEFEYVSNMTDKQRKMQLATRICTGVRWMMCRCGVQATARVLEGARVTRCQMYTASGVMRKPLLASSLSRT
jgi:hypothetical protein